MNLKLIVPPLIALLGAVGVLIFQFRALSSVRARTEMLTREIAGAADSPSHALHRLAGKTPVSWRRLGDSIAGQRAPGIFARQELLRADAEIRSMTPAQLLAALAEIATLDLDIPARGQLDPKLIAALGEIDPAAASARLTAIREKHRADVLSEWVSFLGRQSNSPGDGALLGYASLVREMLPPAAQTSAIVKPISTLARQDGYEQIDRYFDNSAATPAERAAGVATAMATKFEALVWRNRINPSEIDAVRQ